MRPRDLGRERSCFSALSALSGEGFVLVGGYAVSALARTRFSVDLDIVIRAGSRERFRAILREAGWTRSARAPRVVPYGRFERWSTGRPRNVSSVDLMVDGVSDRVTGITRGYEELLRRSTRVTAQGFDPASRCPVTVPAREIMIALKLQPGRLTDMRDVAALAAGPVDREFLLELLAPIPEATLARRLSAMKIALGRKEFRDSFKGVFALDAEAFRIYENKTAALIDWVEARLGRSP